MQWSSHLGYTVRGKLLSSLPSVYFFKESSISLSNLIPIYTTYLLQINARNGPLVFASVVKSTWEMRLFPEEME